MAADQFLTIPLKLIKAGGSSGLVAGPCPQNLLSPRRRYGAWPERLLPEGRPASTERRVRGWLQPNGAGPIGRPSRMAAIPWDHDQSMD